MNKKAIFMAFASGKESTESTPVKRYIGIAPVYVKAVNPKKDELEKLYGTTLEKEPDYQGSVEIDGKEVPTVRLDFIVATDAEKCGIDLVSKVTIFLRQAYLYNREKTKVKVIDKYGRTAWVTSEELKTKAIPMYSNGPARLDADYRPLYQGEEDLTGFLQAYLNIPSVDKYVNGTWVLSDTPAESESRLDNIVKYFNGDYSELRDIIKFQPNNKVKVMFGVRNTSDGKMYQTTFTQKFLRNNASNVNAIQKVLDERKAAGALADIEFSTCDLKEYTVEATSFSSPSEATSAPFDTSDVDDIFG